MSNGAVMFDFLWTANHSIDAPQKYICIRIARKDVCRTRFPMLTGFSFFSLFFFLSFVFCSRAVD